MTAQVAIMNKEAIALASDSAATLTAQKIFSSANKLFTLSKYHPVGIMVYGSAIFTGVPWEVIIKVYRNNLDTDKFNTLEEYATNFIEFLDNNGNPLFPNSAQDEYVRGFIDTYFSLILEHVNKTVNSILLKKPILTKEKIEQIVTEIIRVHYEWWTKADNIPSIPQRHNKDIIDKYETAIEKTIEKIFGKFPLLKKSKNQLKEIAGNLFSKYPQSIPGPKDIKIEDYSGVVIAGFGEKDFFPSLESFLMRGIANNKLNYRKITSSKINFGKEASIIAFAQREMVDIFMERIDSNYRETEEIYLSKFFHDYVEIIVNTLEKYTDKEKEILKKKLFGKGEKVLKDHFVSLERYRKEMYVDPIVTVVSVLPKDELAAMAESLVSLTSFKRRVTLESETVGGPIDVAVISKGDGFIWIKRKHYFKTGLNPQFLANYYREV